MEVALTREASLLAGKVLAVDPGSKRVGVAISDATGKIAFPLTVLSREGDSHIKDLLDLATEHQVVELVIGLPKTLKGADGRPAEEARALAQRLKQDLGLPVALFDERLTTVQAQASLHRGGVKEKGQRPLVDKVAATLLLQAFLDTRNAAEQDS